MDLYGNLTLGFTSLNVDDNNSSARYESTGTYAELELGARFYLGNSFYLTPKFQFSSMNLKGEYANIFNNELKGEWDAIWNKIFHWCRYQALRTSKHAVIYHIICESLHISS